MLNILCKHSHKKQKIVWKLGPFPIVFRIQVELQWTLSISTTLYLELLSISNKKFGPLDICVLSKLFLSLILNFSISNKNLGPLQLFFPLSRTFSRLRVHLHSK